MRTMKFNKNTRGKVKKKIGSNKMKRRKNEKKEEKKRERKKKEREKMVNKMITENEIKLERTKSILWVRFIRDFPISGILFDNNNAPIDD